MKDPLDERSDPYQHFNEEAKRQGNPFVASLETKPKDIREMFGSLRPSAQTPALLQDARDKLTRAEKRMEVDIYFYHMGDVAELDEPLPEPDWGWEQAPLPELVFDASFLVLVTGDEENLIETIQFSSVTLSTLSRYDEVMEPVLDVVFDK